MGKAVSGEPSLPEAALRLLAEEFHSRLGATWLALTPVQDGVPVGPRSIAVTHATAHITHQPSKGVAELLDWLRTQPTPWSFGTRADLPDRLAALLPEPFPYYLAHPLFSGPDLIGLLELARNDAVRSAWDFDLLARLSPLAALLADDRLARHQTAELQGRLDREVPYLRDELRAERDLRTLTGDSPAMRAVRLAIQQVARTDSTVLILGETGTGKELVARAIHQLSPRRERLLVRVNAAALAPTIVASELFGHEAGAFTGASKRRVGRFELAHRGTLFLDEVAEIAPEIQVMLLRVLQEKTIERVGGNETIPVDVRLVAATHQDLARLAGEGRFRADLFYRLNVFPIRVPPLRERREDIPDLVKHFILQGNRRMGRRVEAVEPDSLRRLLDYSWPGNIRELENLIERAMIVAPGGTLRIDPSWLPSDLPESNRLHDLEHHSILDALRRCQGRVYGPGGAAALLGVKPTTLYGKMRKHGISRDSGSNV
jgi:formate hydrogenlyase transcriptional activator